MTKIEFKRNLSDLKALFSEEKNVLKKILRAVMQEILEQEMTHSRRPFAQFDWLV